MNELIRVTVNEKDEQLVSGRELYRYLEVNEKYTQWFDRMITYGFIENIDFTSLSEKTEKPKGGRPKQDHAMKLDMAKEISMIQRTEKGKRARRYFIEVEKEHAQLQVEVTNQKKARPKSLNTVLRKNVTTAKYMEELGISKGIASAKAIELTEKETGADLSAWKVLLPFKIDKESTYNPTELGKMIGCKAQATNKLLIKYGLQIRLDNGNYEVTELGEKYAELLPFARHGHSDYQIKWKKSVLEVIGKEV